MSIIKVKTGGITADAITDALIADDVVGTEHLTANEVDTTALGADAVTGAQLADDAVNSEHYTDGSIDTAHIADAQITTAKLSTAVLTGATDIGAAIADADLFLVDDGAGGTLRKTAASRIKTYVGSPGLTLLTSGDITSTTSSFVIDSTYVNDTYEHYMLILRGKDAGDGIQLNMRYRNDAGNASITDNYSYRIGEIADNGGGTNTEGESLIRLSYNHPGNGANEGFNMVLHFLSPRSNLVPTTCQWTLSHADSSDTFHVNHGAARRNDGTEKHGGFVLFFSNGGDFANGTNYELYGFKK
jgi:hypothetical protein